MASQVDVCNRALIKIGGGQITSISDNTKAARILSGLWATVLQSELKKRYWSFALARASLAKLSTAPDWGFANAYQLPVDYLKMVQVNDLYVAPSQQDYINGDSSPYAIEGTTIATDFADPLKIRYVRNITDPGLFDPLFVEVLASKLAYESCYGIHQSREGQKTAMEDYRMAVKDAAQSNAIERPPQSIPDDAWMLGRL